MLYNRLQSRRSGKLVTSTASRRSDPSRMCKTEVLSSRSAQRLAKHHRSNNQIRQGEGILEASKSNIRVACTVRQGDIDTT